MADDLNTSTAPESATPVSAEPVEAAKSEISEAPERTDAWDFSDVKEDEEKTDEPAKAEPAVKDAKKDEKLDEADEKPLEDQVLEEIFDPEKAKEKADKAASEAKSKEEEVDKQDPAAMIKAQENASGRAWAERAEKVYTPLKDFKYGNKTAAELREGLKGFLGDEKASEYSQFEAHELVDNNPDAAFQRAYAIKMLAKDPSWTVDVANIPSLDDLVNGKLVPSGNTADADAGKETPAIPAELAEITKDLDSVIDFDWSDPENDDQFVDEREAQMAKTIRNLEAKAISEAAAKAELDKKLGKLEKDVEQITTTGKTKEQQDLNTQLQTTVKDFRSSIESKMIPWIAKNTGLEVSKDDTPEVVAFKERKMALYTGDKYQKDNELGSRFETFAYEESTIKADLTKLTENLIDVQLKEAQAKLKNDHEAAQKYHKEAEDFRIPMIQMLAKANDEFKEIHINPDVRLMGLKAAARAEPILEAEKRIETVATGGGIPASKKTAKDYASADDVWGSMDTEAAEEERLRSAA